jgi:uncharacterized protein (DUF4415 family)
MVLLSPPLVDDHFAYGEVPYRGYGKIDDDYYLLAFTIRDGRLRAISLRPMTSESEHAMRSRRRTSVTSNRVIEDEDNPEWTEEDFRLAKSQTEFPPEVLAAFPKMRGRPPKAESERKVLTSIRLHPIVLDHFKATGPGWQTRMEEILIEAAFGSRHKPTNAEGSRKRARAKPKELPKSRRKAAVKKSRPNAGSYKKVPATRRKA